MVCRQMINMAKITLVKIGFVFIISGNRYEIRMVQTENNMMTIKQKTRGKYPGLSATLHVLKTTNNIWWLVNPCAGVPPHFLTPHMVNNSLEFWLYIITVKIDFINRVWISEWWSVMLTCIG
jgi:hypothetical protein